MRVPLVLLPLLFVGLAAGQDQETEAPPPGPRIERVSSGVIVVRGSRKRQPVEEEAQEEDAAKEEEAREDKQPRGARRSGYIIDSSGRRVSTNSIEVESRSEDGSSRTLSRTDINGHQVASVSTREKVISRSSKGTVTERSVQRYDDAGRPSSQEVTRIETRKLPDGSTETVETSYSPDPSGRMRAVARKVERSKSSGGATTTTVTESRPSINGGFSPISREETVERRTGAGAERIDKTRKESDGTTRLQTVQREETTRRTAGKVETSETSVYTRSGFSNRLDLTGRRVGRKETRADGSSSEKIESFGKLTASGATNINATRMTLQSVETRETTVGADGTERQRSVVMARSEANTSQMRQQSVTERVSTPTAGGANVQTTTFEPGANGKLRATQVVNEKVEN